MEKETKKDILAFEELYNGLVNRYNETGVGNDTKFFYDCIHETSYLSRFVRERKKEFGGFDRRYLIDFALPSLCKMEEDLLKVEQAAKEWREDMGIK